MKPLLIPIILVALITKTHALIISEIMSNPIGSDSGREWLEVYNDGQTPIDLSKLTISVKGATPDIVTQVSGGASLLPGDYAVIGATVSGATHFTDDYPSFTKPLFKSSVTLANTGTLSLQILIDGQVMDTLSSYTAAKEGRTYARIGAVFQTGNPTPGEANTQAPVEEKTSSASQAADSSNQSNSSSGSFISSTVSAGGISYSNGSVLTDIIVSLPQEKLVISGAETEFIVKSTLKGGHGNELITYTWAFGDGGQGTGTTTKYTYAYTGRYLATVEATHGAVIGQGKMIVKVVSPDIVIIGAGKDTRGNYLDIGNPNPYELNLSQWRLTFNGMSFPFPKNTILNASSTTRVSGSAMGFNGVTLTDGMVIKILFPHNEEVTRYSYSSIKQINIPATVQQSNVVKPLTGQGIQILQTKKTVIQKKIVSVATSTHASTTHVLTTTKKDTRLASWVKGILGK